MNYTRVVALSLCAIALGGCYSSARHIANVRPDIIKPDATLTAKYRLERIVLKKSSFSRKVAGGYEQFDIRKRELERKREEARKNLPEQIDIDTYMNAAQERANSWGMNQMPADYRQKYYESIRRSYYNSTPEARRNAVLEMKNPKFSAEESEIEEERRAYAKLDKEDKKSGPNGTHYADTQMIFRSVRDALRRDYPSVFTSVTDAIPIAVVVDWGTSYKMLPDYASIFSGWFWPESAEQETVYQLYVIENPGGKTDDELWNAYMAAPSSYPRPPECGSAVRTTEVWESGLVLPTGFIPCPGESDFPKTYCFMRRGKDSLVNSPSTKMGSRECFKHMVFEPKVDGDVLAAAIMRILNRKHRIAEAADMMKGGVK